MLSPLPENDPEPTESGNRPAHVILIDDEPDFREAMAVLFELEGFRVTQLADGDRAVERARQGLAADLLLVDQRMPGRSGSETLAVLRTLGVEAPAVLVSAVSEVRTLAARHGFAAGVQKPVHFTDLLAVIRRLLGTPPPAANAESPR